MYSGIIKITTLSHVSFNYVKIHTKYCVGQSMVNINFLKKKTTKNNQQKTTTITTKTDRKTYASEHVPENT